MKKVRILCLALVVCLLVPMLSIGAMAEEKVKIGFVVKVINPFFTVMLAGAQSKADELGIELLTGAAAEQTNTEEQIAIVQDMVTKGVKAICIAPMDSEALLPCLSDAQKQGVIVVNLDNRLNSDTAEKLGMTPIPFVGVSDESSAYLAGKAICDAIGGKGDVAIIEGIQSADNAQQRKAGAERAFGEYADVKIVASQTANWNAEEGLTVFTNILQANPDIKGVFCANDAMSFGVIQAIEAAGKTGQIFVASIDAEDAAIDNVKKGLELATVYNNQDTQAAKALEVALDMINGKTLESPEIVVDTILYTKDNLPG
jgi:ribose transport system substrate-binding protein